MSKIFKRVAIVFVLFCFFTSGCALIKLKEEVKQGMASTVLVGRISTGFHGKGPIVVAAYSVNHGEREVAHFSVLHDYTGAHIRVYAWVIAYNSG